jgi:hypothetical protein
MNPKTHRPVVTWRPPPIGWADDAFLHREDAVQDVHGGHVDQGDVPSAGRPDRGLIGRKTAGYAGSSEEAPTGIEPVYRVLQTRA